MQLVFFLSLLTISFYACGMDKTRSRPVARLSRVAQVKKVAKAKPALAVEPVAAASAVAKRSAAGSSTARPKRVRIQDNQPADNSVEQQGAEQTDLRDEAEQTEQTSAHGQSKQTEQTPARQAEQQVIVIEDEPPHPMPIVQDVQEQPVQAAQQVSIDLRDLDATMPMVAAAMPLAVSMNLQSVSEQNTKPAMIVIKDATDISRDPALLKKYLVKIRNMLPKSVSHRTIPVDKAELKRPIARRAQPTIASFVEAMGPVQRLQVSDVRLKDDHVFLASTLMHKLERLSLLSDSAQFQECLEAYVLFLERSSENTRLGLCKYPLGVHKRTVLHIVAEKGLLQYIDRLLAVGIFIDAGGAMLWSLRDAQDAEGWTPIHEAVRKGHLDVVKRLKAAGADMAVRSKKNATLLHAAASADQPLIIDYLINDCSFAVDIHANSEMTPWHFAAAKGQVNAMRCLKKHGAQELARAKGGFTALHLATMSGIPAAVIYLVQECNVDVALASGQGQTPLHCAAERNQCRALRALLQLRAPLYAQDARNRSALHTATEWGNIAAVRYLLEVETANSLSDDQGRTFKQMKDSRGKTALHRAAVCGHKDVVRLLLKYNFDREELDNEGSTPLESAVRAALTEQDELTKKDQISTLQELLHAGATVRISTIGRIRPLQYAFESKDKIIYLHLLNQLRKDGDFIAKIRTTCDVCDLPFFTGADLNSLNFSEIIEMPCCREFVHRTCAQKCFGKNEKCPSCNETVHNRADYLLE